MTLFEVLMFDLYALIVSIDKRATDLVEYRKVTAQEVNIESAALYSDKFDKEVTKYFDNNKLSTRLVNNLLGEEKYQDAFNNVVSVPIKPEGKRQKYQNISLDLPDGCTVHFAVEAKKKDDQEKLSNEIPFDVSYMTAKQGV